ncbi:PP2C family protein-serine/threonine phosphatase [Actinokineospora spheciospongiae]|uniref:PP2C family protein-serine/threonine phosphatase n=1 Tax=Actinokineospora spheciospongiae TaxID=909613 RepID=UPI001F341EC5|nr:PP2C family serine/threonine-protein phosphatase [Actinokineospora spheciospongiae]
MSVPVIRVGAATDVGLVRAANEDCFLAEGRVFAVADGMGGHAAGDVASRMAVDGLRELDVERVVRGEDVRARLVRVNADIVAAAERHPEQAGMGTTVTGVCLADVDGEARWVVFNIGDSRVYRYADGGLEQLTRDHSEVAEMVAAGRLSPEEAAVHARRNVVTRALGSDAPPEPDLWPRTPVVGERFLICSDGLTGEVADQDIAAVLGEVVNPQEAADRLVDAALAAGGRDNVTVVLVDHVASESGAAAEADQVTEAIPLAQR